MPKQAAEQRLVDFKNGVNKMSILDLVKAANKKNRDQNGSQPPVQAAQSALFGAAQKASKDTQGKRKGGFFGPSRKANSKSNSPIITGKTAHNTSMVGTVDAAAQMEIRRLQTDFSDLQSSTHAQLEQLQSAKKDAEKAVEEMQIQMQQKEKQSEVQHVQVQMELEAVREEKQRMNSMLKTLMDSVRDLQMSSRTPNDTDPATPLKEDHYDASNPNESMNIAEVEAELEQIGER